MAAIETKGTSGLGALKLGMDALAGFVGFGCAIASVLGLYAVVPGLVTAAGTDWLWIRLVYAISMAVGFLVVSLGAHAIARHKCIVLIAGSVVGVSAMALVLFVPAGPRFLQLSCHSAIAVGMSFLVVQWFGFVCSQPYRMVLMRRALLRVSAVA